MANSLGSLAGNLIAQRSLEILHQQFPALGLIATDFSDAHANYGQSVISRIITTGTANDYDTATGFAATDLSTTDATVTLNKFKYSAFELFPTEYTATNRNLIEDYAKKVAYEIGNAIYADISALFVSANFTSTATVVAVADATRKSVVVAANTALNKRKVSSDRFAIFNSDLYGKLWEDESLVKLSYGADGITVNKLPIVHGVALVENPSMPTTANLIGVQGAKDAIVVATRVPADVSAIAPGVPKISNVDNVLHPELGITMQVRAFENPLKGSVQYVACLIYGVAKGNPLSLQLIKSA